MEVVDTKSTTEYEMERMGCSARAKFGKLMVLGCYSGTMMYLNLYEDTDVKRRYRVGVMPINFREFKTYALHISDYEKYSNGNSCHAGIVRSKFNKLR